MNPLNGTRALRMSVYMYALLYIAYNIEKYQKKKKSFFFFYKFSLFLVTI